jgi:hypothetical protein
MKNLGENFKEEKLEEEVWTWSPGKILAWVAVVVAAVVIGLIWWMNANIIIDPLPANNNTNTVVNCSDISDEATCLERNDCLAVDICNCVTIERKARQCDIEFDDEDRCVCDRAEFDYCEDLDCDVYDFVAWQTYTNNEFGFSLDYPNNWSGDEHDGVVFFTVTKDDNLYVELAQLATNYEGSIEDWFTEQYEINLEVNSAYAEPYNLDNVEDYFLHDLALKKIKPFNVDKSEEAFYFMHNLGIFSITYTDPVTYEQNLDEDYFIARQIVNTFQIIDQPDTDDWQTYTNNDFYYTIKYLDGWVVDENPYPGCEVIGCDRIRGEDIYITIRRELNDLGLEEYYTNSPHWRGNNNYNVNVNGLDAIKETYDFDQYSLQSDDYTANWRPAHYFIRNDNYIYNIELSIKQYADEDKYRKLFDEIVNTFQFTDQASNVFDPETAQVGDQVAGMTIVYNDVYIEHPGGSEPNRSVIFSGEVELTGTVEHIGPGILGERICFKDFDEESLAKLPRIIDETRSTHFCFDNREESLELWPEVGLETATLTIDNYTINSYPGEVVNTATLIVDQTACADITDVLVCLERQDCLAVDVGSCVTYARQAAKCGVILDLLCLDENNAFDYCEDLDCDVFADDVNQQQAYINQEYSFSFNYPNDWELTGADDLLQINFPDWHEDYPEGGSTLIIATFEDSMQDFIDTYNETGESVAEIIGQEPIVVGGVNAIKLTGTTFLGVNKNFIFIETGDWNHLISYYDFGNEHQAIIDSWQFIY